jgi:hypothetical protein
MLLRREPTMIARISGECPECHDMVPIEPAGAANDRQATWVPKPHPASDDDTGGRQCPGTGKAIT